MQHRGRAALANPTGRFEPLEIIPDLQDPLPEDLDAAEPTILLRDSTKKILARNNSPDVPFNFGINPYRGCEHGCIYCYARPTHEFLGFSPGLDFETRIVVKEQAPELLRTALASRRWQPQVVALSGNTDCYQPAEKRLRLTRGCLEVFLDFRNPVGIITKNALVLRDLDLLQRLSRHGLVSVTLSITTLDAEICGKMEPRTSRPARRLQAIRELASAGVPVNVNVAPVIPGLTDSEIPSILEAAADAGALGANYIMLRLPHAVKTLFFDWVNVHFPNRVGKIEHALREIRSGALSDPNFGSRMSGTGERADVIRHLFETSRRRYGLDKKQNALNTAAFRVPTSQGDLFEDSD